MAQEMFKHISIIIVLLLHEYYILYYSLLLGTFINYDRTNPSKFAGQNKTDSAISVQSSL